MIMQIISPLPVNGLYTPFGSPVIGGQKPPSGNDGMRLRVQRFASVQCSRVLLLNLLPS